MTTISKPVRRFAAVSLLAAAVLAVYATVIGPVWDFFIGTREQIEDRRVLLGRLAAATEKGPRAVELQRAADAVPLSSLVLKGDTEAIQLAGLQTLVGEAAAKQGLRVVSARSLPASDREGLRLIGLRFDVRGDLQSLQALLHRIESIEPSLLVEGLQIRASSGSEAAAGARGALLDSSISVYGAQPPRKG